MATAAFEFDRVNVFYGDSHALHNVSFTLRPHTLLALLGRNGAGKTTCMHAACGFNACRTGEIRLFGKSVQAEPVGRRSATGLALVPQGRRVFPSLSVEENLWVAEQGQGGEGQTTWRRKEIYDLFPRLHERRRRCAATLSGGEQQMLAIGRALVTNPKVLLLDEPSEGLAPQMIEEVAKSLRVLKSEGMSIVLVEQNLRIAMQLADDVALLASGRTVFQGTAVELRERPALLDEYLGVTQVQSAG
ncbi:ABC transporter ATP-binding protein [Cupriavidus sp. UYPR2.512]|uniref:ABC transporter ATP-binding protein n=1 Tax=Cupriavidus sp. UYPR2.512 TaxID=1080187 RepID=UPI001E5C8EA6|nr:ABC transporter ATP-binding protein [Cupriavidus sp. UYPR2.512]